MIETLKIKGKFKVKHFRKGKLIGEYTIPNGITNEGKNNLLDVQLGANSQIVTWYIGLIQDGGYSALAAGDTMSSHAGWTEFTGYDETFRQTWGAGAAASQSITNASAATFTINTGDILKGIFVTSNNTISGTDGTLWSTGLFTSGDVTVASSDSFKITYTVSVS